MIWHVVTGEFPPQTGGVSDYTRAVAQELATAGETVHVWCPPAASGGERVVGVTVHREAGRWLSSDLRRLDRAIDVLPGPRRLLVQWVPQAFGRRSLNMAFCRWVRRRAGSGDALDVMVHEPFLPFREGAWRHDAAALVQRAMAAVLLGRASRVWVSIPAWTDYIARYCSRQASIRWLPVPSGIPVVHDPDATAAVRAHIVAGSTTIVGLLGPYGGAGRDDLDALAAHLLTADATVACLVMGRGSHEFRERVLDRRRELSGRLASTGEVTAREYSASLQACDIVALPFPDGASSRRTTLMAALDHSRPVVTTDGRLSEPLWRESGAVRLVPARDVAAMAATVLALKGDAAARETLGGAGRRLYAERFHISHTVRALLTEAPAA